MGILVYFCPESTLSYLCYQMRLISDWHICWDYSKEVNLYWHLSSMLGDL